MSFIADFLASVQENSDFWKGSTVENFSNQSTLDVLDTLDDFDILLFHGQDYWFSYIIEYGTWSDFSHVALFLKGAPEIDGSLTGPLMLESGTETFPDAVQHKIKCGVQITDVKKAVAGYTGKVYYRKLNRLSQGQFKEQSEATALKAKLAQVYQEIANAPYDDAVTDLLKVALDADLGDCQRTDSFFCSALVSYIYVKLGFLPTGVRWDLVKPKAFATDTEIQLIEANFGPLIRIK